MEPIRRTDVRSSQNGMRAEDESSSRRKPPNVRRRSTRQGSARDRHGMVFDESNGSTIRAVTPEAMTTPPNEPAMSGQSNPVSPVHSSARSGYVGQSRSRDYSGSVSNDDENTIDSRRRRARTKSGTTDDIGPDTSPGSFVSKARKRIGSITTSSALNSRMEDQVASIGFPSVSQNASDFDDRYGPKTPRRTFSPDSVSTFASGGARSPIWIDYDRAKILQLMKTTCGRMHGILFFRAVHTSAWASGYCSIQVATGSLALQVKGDVTQTQILIPDLRGCIVKTQNDPETQAAYLTITTASTGMGFHLRPSVPETFESWLAALLCWQPLRPRGLHNKLPKPQNVVFQETRPSGQRRASEATTQKSMAIIKVGQMRVWDGPLPSGSQALSIQRANMFGDTREQFSLWQSISCTLHENGDFRIFREGESEAISTTPLSQLSRCAVQRLDRSILDTPYCLAVYPHYTIRASNTRQKRPMILSLESRVAFEAWFVLLRALTVPELYGPKHSGIGVPSGQDTEGMYRVEQQISVKLTEAKFAHSFTERDHQTSLKSKRKSARPQRAGPDVYIDVVCGQDLKARSAIKQCSNSVLWIEEFSFRDLPSLLNRLAVIARIGNPGEQEWTMIAHGPYDMSGDAAYLTGVSGIEVSSHDSVLGKVEIPMDELEQRSNIDKWWPVIDSTNKVVGQILMRISLKETVVLMSDEYKELYNLLHSFDNSLTSQIAQLMGPELKQLSDVLLDIFQSTNKVHDWLTMLIEEDIDGIHRETPPLRMRFSSRLQSSDSYETAEQREVLVRDLNRSANQEANLLFRGNSLVTKALDSHMRRLGGEYLEQVLGPRLRTIADRDPDCEVDPMRVSSGEQLERNWVALLNLTQAVWKDISESAELCPPALRVLFRHIRSCAEDRYGSFIRTVKYTSISGFLFLRFFCPAILNPKLFGLAADHPPERAKRTFTLLAKSLNTLASMAKFGTKEVWMEPMNKFLTAATPEFRTFIDNICGISATEDTTTVGLMEPQYATPTQIKGRLPPASREGLPSLPFLLDTSKLLSELVDLWTTHAPPNLADEPGLEDSVKEFHKICVDLRAHTKDCLSGAEQAEQPDGRLEPRWQQVLKEQHQVLRTIPDDRYTAAASEDDSDLTALPQARSEAEDTSESEAVHTATPSGGWERRLPMHSANQRTMTDSTNSSTVSFEASDDGRARMGGSRDGSTKTRLFDLMSSSGRRKGRLDRSHHDDE